ncbi:pectate lyase [Aquimarina sp. W85]|uniref:pectate lyase n=1 Tax=Aquimarina rhodophyticola TaxID=3342246 RepID=UPI00366BF84B
MYRSTKDLIVSLLLIIIVYSSVNSQVLDSSWRTIATQKYSVWFSSKDALRIAENVLLYQRDIGGWPKNIPMHQPIDDLTKEKLLVLKSNSKDCTIDNGATTQELLFLSNMYRHTKDDRYKNSFLKGLTYILEAQYDNGGWPQFYPLKKGYYSHITYNDDAMVNILNLLKELKNETEYYSIELSTKQLEKVSLAFQKGIDCILKTQYKQNGMRTVWCAQHDATTLAPTKARSYELPSLSGAESAQITLLLMSIKNPSNEIIKAIHSAVAWFEKTKIVGLREDRIYNKEGEIINKLMVYDQNAPAIWARFMDLENNTPFFCDRDGVKKTSIQEIGLERRNGYAWYKHEPQKVLDSYPQWKKEYGLEKVSSSQTVYDIEVAQDGTGDYTSIQKAIDNVKSFPYNNVTIFIKNGVYKEKIKIHEWNPHIRLIGENKDRTIVTNDDYFDKIGLGRNSTFYTYTLLVEANNVVLKNLTIQNTSGDIGQAIALSVVSDKVAVINCNILGNQDTLYISGNGKQYYKNCYIEGTTDFIFGKATAFFEDCEIYSKKNSYITAAATSKDSKFGYVFKNCKLNANNFVNHVYLGRPWRKHAKTVFINCKMGSHIAPTGWHDWSKPEAQNTTYYAEYKNYGPGYQPERRVKWAYQMQQQQAEIYTLKNVIGSGANTSQKEWYEQL